jgi:biotin operon repressor
MIVIRDSINYRYTKVDKNVFVIKGMTDGAKVLYGYLAGLPTGRNFSDKYILKALGISRRTLANRKRELKNMGLILIDQISPRSYVLFVGNTLKRAHEVREEWKNSNDE